MADGEARPTEGIRSDDAQIRTFLIADVRGYSVFTQERGDEAAAVLAGKFANVAREILEARGGTGLEFRGDEVMAVFDSARQAIRASVELQRRFVDETVADPTLPLPVGIGLDAGEAVDGYCHFYRHVPDYRNRGRDSDPGSARSSGPPRGPRRAP